MTTSRFNLLPARYAQRVIERRWARAVAVTLVVLLGVLAAAGFNQSRRLRDGERRRNVEEARNAALVVRSGELVRFRKLADAVAGRERILAVAMGTEVSWANLLASLGRTFPADSSLTSVTLESKLPPFGGVPLVKPGDEKSVIGSAVLKGYSVERFTPGVERLLKLLVTVTGVSEPRLQVGSSEDIGTQPVTAFEGSTFIDGRAMSGRYAQGLPAEDDIDIPVISGVGPATAAPSTAGKPAPK